MHKNNMSKKEKIMFAVFNDIPFPFFSLDLMKLRQSIERQKSKTSFVAFPISKQDKETVAAFGAIMRKIRPTDELYSVLEKSKLSKNRKKIIDLLVSSEKFYNFGLENKNLIWKENSFWPLAYSTLLSQLFQIFQLFEKLSQERIKDIGTSVGEKEVNLLSEYPRNMPTEIHYAFASLGAMVGGSHNFQYLSFFASKPQIRDSSINIRYAELVGYSNNDSNELDKSGIIVVPMSLAGPLMELQNAKNVFGSISIDEINLANEPKKDFYSINKLEVDDKDRISGFILDKYYRSVFFGRKLNGYAMYGQKNQLRDYYTDFYNTINSSEQVRCKHYCMPVIEVGSIDEINSLISSIPKRGESGLFFRGQTSFYDITRSEKVKNLLFGDSESCEPSLVTSASRSNFDYDRLHFALKYFLEHETIYKEYDCKKSKKSIFLELEKLKKSPKCELDYAIMALAQHYGLPSHGLDVTTDIDVAIWFATNTFFKAQDEKSYYTKKAKLDWNKDNKKWPVIYVFQNVLNSTAPSLQNCYELEELGLKALRPERQSAKFFHGGHSDHQNRLAESLVCVIRLRPNNYETTVDFDYLFPSPEEDLAYKFMLDFSNNDMLSLLDVDREKVAKYHT